MHDFQISCKEKKDEVTGMGEGIKGRVGWGGLMETGGQPQHKGEMEKRGRKVLLLEGSKVEGNRRKALVRTRVGAESNRGADREVLTG